MMRSTAPVLDAVLNDSVTQRDVKAHQVPLDEGRTFDVGALTVTSAARRPDSSQDP